MTPQAPDPELDLVVIGDCNPDVLVTGDDVTPAFGQQEKLVDGIGLGIGGAAAITAVAAARLGLRCALVAAIGDDPPGHIRFGQPGRRRQVEADAEGVEIIDSDGELRCSGDSGQPAQSLPARSVRGRVLRNDNRVPACHHLHDALEPTYQRTLG